MAHKITMEIPKRTITKEDVIFVVSKNSVKIGELLISKGNIEWWPAGKKRHGKKMSWRTLADQMEQFGQDIYK